jgi:TolB-like protein/DNA-binding winged helix-turn-helix (wHTH) protein
MVVMFRSYSAHRGSLLTLPPSGVTIPEPDRPGSRLERHMDSRVESDVWYFDDFRLDGRGGGLSRRDPSGTYVPVALGSRATGVLTVLVAAHGELVSKDTLLSEVWSGLTVEEKNLTVQISALRRVLDNGDAGPGMIATVPGRGYRFIRPVARSGEIALPDGPSIPDQPQGELTAAPPPAARWRRWHTIAAAAVVVLVMVVATVLVRLAVSPTPPTPARLSLVVLPFQNLSGDARDDYLVDGITDDLTTDLSHVPQAFVIASASARTYKGRAVDARQIGRELGVRYMLEGSVRRMGAALRVNAQLIATDTGGHVWSDRFDEQVADLVLGQDAILARLRGALGISLVEIETARSRRAPPSSPDAFDLILQARALTNQPASPARNAAAQALFERALGLDPDSVPAMLGIADLILSRGMGFLNQFVTSEEMDRAVSLLERARASDPHGAGVMVTSALLAQARGEWDALGVAAGALTERFPNMLSGYEMLATAQRYTGHPDEAIALYEKSIRLDPRSPSLFLRYGFLGFALFQVGRYDEAVTWFERSIEANPDAPVVIRSGRIRMIAISLALGGRLEEARRAMEKATAAWPFATVRSNAPENVTSDALRADIGRVMEGARLSGLRDHADEDANFGVAAITTPRDGFPGYTPTTSPQFATIHTRELSELLAQRRPLVIDAMTWWWGVSLPGAVGLPKSGIGGRLDDAVQTQLQRKVLALADGDLARPVVAVGWNSESFDGYNLALRLSAMGFREVFWYRGGREAWEVAGLPEAPLTPNKW